MISKRDSGRLPTVKHQVALSFVTYNGNIKIQSCKHPTQNVSGMLSFK